MKNKFVLFTLVFLSLAIFLSCKESVHYYTITFKCNNGLGEIEPITVQSGTEVKIPLCNYCKRYYDFVGWTTEENKSGSEIIPSGRKIVVTEDITLYSVWRGVDVSYSIDIEQTNDISVSVKEEDNLVKITAPQEFKNFRWYIDDTKQQISENTLIINIASLTQGVHEVFVIAEKNGCYYSATVYAAKF